MLLSALSSTVVNLGQPLASNGAEAQLTDATKQALAHLGGTAKNYPAFPVLVVVHTRKSNEDKRAEHIGALTRQALETAGAKDVHVKSVGAAQPAVQASMGNAAEKNERVEIIFVVPGR
jgi:hypothetical protein